MCVCLKRVKIAHRGLLSGFLGVGAHHCLCSIYVTLDVFVESALETEREKPPMSLRSLSFFFLGGRHVGRVEGPQEMT